MTGPGRSGSILKNRWTGPALLVAGVVVFAATSGHSGDHAGADRPKSVAAANRFPSSKTLSEALLSSATHKYNPDLLMPGCSTESSKQQKALGKILTAQGFSLGWTDSSLPGEPTEPAVTGYRGDTNFAAFAVKDPVSGQCEEKFFTLQGNPINTGTVVLQVQQSNA